MADGRDMIDARRWADMDPLVRQRFHELANAITRQEGIIAGLSMRVPETPAVVPVLTEKVHALEKGYADIKGDVQSVRDDVGEMRKEFSSLALRVVGGTTVLTALVTGVVQLVLAK